MSMSSQEKSVELLKRQIEAVLFTATDGATVQELSQATQQSISLIRKTLDNMRESYASQHGMEVVELAGKWFMTSAADMSEVLERFRVADEREHIRLTRASLETLAVVAYSQPVTRSEIEAIRGVRCDRVIDTLLSYGLVRIAGRRKSTGSPLLYRTSSQFLKIFGLGAISDLPTVAELEELKRRGPLISDVEISIADAENTEEAENKDETQ